MTVTHDGRLTRRAYTAERTLTDELRQPLLAAEIRDDDTAAIDALRNEAARIVRAVIGSAWWTAATGPTRVETLASRSRTYSRGGWTGTHYMGGFDSGHDRRWLIRLGRTRFLSSRQVIAHELGHVLHIHACDTGTAGRLGVDSYTHGPGWAGAYLALTRLICGDDAALLLEASLAVHGITANTRWLPDATGRLVDPAPLIHPSRRTVAVGAPDQLTLI